MEHVSASVSTLFRLTEDTYATSEHADDFFADEYIGRVSVRGKDRFYTGLYTAYPTYSKVTYDVQGDISSKQVDSTGKNDDKVRTGSITVKDKWNLGSKTKVYGNYGSGYFSDDSSYRVNEEAE